MCIWSHDQLSGGDDTDHQDIMLINLTQSISPTSTDDVIQGYDMECDETGEDEPESEEEDGSDWPTTNDGNTFSVTVSIKIISHLSSFTSSFAHLFKSQFLSLGIRSNSQNKRTC